MRRAGYTNKPCPACGVTILHPVGGICEFCRDKLKHYDQIMAERAATPDTVVMVAKEREHALPYISVGAGDATREVQQGFLRLIAHTSTETGRVDGAERIFPVEMYYSGSSSAHEWNCYVRIRPDHAATIRDTYKAVMKLAQSAYAEGHSRGRSLLAQLASGEMTSDKFNETVLRQEKQ